MEKKIYILEMIILFVMGVWTICSFPSDVLKTKIQNDKSYDELITVLYDYEDLKELNNKIEDFYDDDYVFDIDSELRHFKIEVLRKTPAGYYYIILKAKNDYKMFIFFDEEKTNFYSMLVDEFISEKHLLSKIKVNKTTIEELEGYSDNAFSITSAGSDAFYITKEGYVWVLHDFEKVKEIKVFKEDDSLVKNQEIPLYILPIDKK